MRANLKPTFVIAFKSDTKSILGAITAHYPPEGRIPTSGASVAPLVLDQRLNMTSTTSRSERISKPIHNSRILPT
jgi:hypothetical protein